MIELARRGNMKYFIYLFFFHYVRTIESILISKILNFNNIFVFTVLMYLGELFGGLAVIIYQNCLLNKNKGKQKNILLKIITDRQMKYRKEKRDKLYIIIILIFFASFFDFTEFYIFYKLPEISVLSPSCDQRLCVIITITSALLCTYGLKFKMGKHHIFSLIGMSICSLIVFVLELIFKSQNTEFGYFIFSLFLVIFSLSFVSFIDVIERYLIEFDFVNQYKILSSEGFIGITMSLILSNVQNKGRPTFILIKTFKELDSGKSILIIFFLILYFILSAGINIYKIICNVVYTPMSKSLPAYFLNPIFNVYYFIWENDFTTKGVKNYFFFISNVILSITIDFFSLVYNEFIILKCFGLEVETHHEISKRTLYEIELVEDENSIESDYNGYYFNN